MTLMAWGVSAYAANTTIATYFDRSTFLNATGSTNASGPLLPTSVFFDRNLPVGAVSLYATRYIFLDYSARLPGNEVVISQGVPGHLASESLDVTLPSAVSAFGFDFVEPHFDPNVDFNPNVDAFVDSVFSVTLFQGRLPLGSFTFNAPDDQAYFVGVFSDQMFNRVEIRELVGTDDNEFYGQFYMSAAPVPEPLIGHMGLLALGAFMLARKPRR